MPLAIGTPTFLGIKKEAVAGTAETTGFVWIPIRAGATLDHAWENILLDHLNTGIAGVQINSAQTGVRVTGSFGCFAFYVAIGYLLEALMGTNTTTGVGPYAHSKTLGNAVTLPSLTLVLHSQDGTRRTYAGCRVTKGTFDLGPGASGQNALGRWSFDIIGAQKSGETTGNSVPTLPTNIAQLVNMSHVSVYSWNGTDYIGTSVQSIKITIDRNLTPVFCVGQAYAADVIGNGFASITCESDLSLSTSDRTLQNGHNNLTSADLTVTIGSGNYTHSFLLKNAIITQYSDKVGSSAGFIMQHVKFAARSTSPSAADGCTITHTNDNANYYD